MSSDPAQVCFADAGAAADAVHEQCHGDAGWYVATATNPWERLKVLHCVDLDGGRYVIVRCASAGVALGAARLLREERGYQGAAAAAGPDWVYLYVYAITPKTNERR